MIIFYPTASLSSVEMNAVNEPSNSHSRAAFGNSFLTEAPATHPAAPLLLAMIEP